MSGFLGMEGVLVSTHCTHAMNHFIYCTAYRSTTTTETLICPGWEILFVPVSQPGTPGHDKRRDPFVPGLATETKGTLLCRLVTPIGTKRAASATWLAHPFVPVGGIFFSSPHFFSISIRVSFQIYFHFNYTNKYKYILICIILVPNI